MLSEVLKKEECAVCRFCCAFRRQSLWEVPKLPAYFVEKYKTDPKGRIIKYIRLAEANIPESAGAFDRSGVITDLRDLYRTDDPEEEAPCPFLDTTKGCILPPEDKPFECSAWPLRYMRMPDGTLKVCLTPTCVAINKVALDLLKQKTSEKWHEQMDAYAKSHPYIILDYREGFIPLE